MIPIGIPLQVLQAAQLADLVLTDIYHHLFQGWQSTAKKYMCLLFVDTISYYTHQFKLVYGAACHKYFPGLLQESITVSVLTHTLCFSLRYTSCRPPMAGKGLA